MNRFGDRKVEYPNKSRISENWITTYRHRTNLVQTKNLMVGISDVSLFWAIFRNTALMRKKKLGSCSGPSSYIIKVLSMYRLEYHYTYEKNRFSKIVFAFLRGWAKTLNKSCVKMTPKNP